MTAFPVRTFSGQFTQNQLHALLPLTAPVVGEMERDEGNNIFQSDLVPAPWVQMAEREGCKNVTAQWRRSQPSLLDNHLEHNLRH